MTAKEYLGQAYRIDQRINSKMEQIASLNLLARKATTVFSDMPGNSTRNIHRMEDVIIKIVDMESEINADIDRLVDLKKEISKTVTETDMVLQNYGVGFNYVRISNSSPQYRWFYGANLNGDYSNALSGFEWDGKYFLMTKYPLINNQQADSENFGQFRVFTKSGKSTGKVFQYVNDGRLSNQNAASFWGFYVDEKSGTPLLVCDGCNISNGTLALEIIKNGDDYGWYRMRLSAPAYGSSYIGNYGCIMKVSGVSLPLYIMPSNPYSVNSSTHYMGFGLGIMKLCLTTINNLSEPVRKLDGQVMKITYDIVDE